MRAYISLGILLLTLGLHLAGCGDERKVIYPYHGADYFNPSDDDPQPPLEDTVIAFEIGYLKDVLQGHHSYLPVTKIDGPERIWGFDFIIGYNASALNFMGAAEGPLFTRPGDYEWEYFTYRFGPFGDCTAGCPSGMLRVVGMAESNDGPHSPLEYRIPDSTTLFTLDFLVSNDRTLECQFIPVSFFWLDCGDNTVAFQYDSPEYYAPIETGISRHVYNRRLERIDVESPFPCSTGANSTCDPPINPDTLRRYIDFYNGGIKIICADSIDARRLGDINLDGIGCEIGDIVVFTNYFIVGTAAFTIDIEYQSWATDVNGNGIPLELADFVYFIRIVIGDAIPVPPPIYDPFFFTTDSSTLSIYATQPVGALFAILEGDVNVSLTSNANVLQIKSGLINSNTHVLLYTFEKSGVVPNGDILQGSSPLNVLYLEAASYYGADFKNIVHGQPGDLPGGDTLTVLAEPNPFSDSTVIAFTPSDTSGWRLQIYSSTGLKVWKYDQSPGSHISHTYWKPENLPAGTYFARITTPSKSGRLTLFYKPE